MVRIIILKICIIIVQIKNRIIKEGKQFLKLIYNILIKLFFFLRPSVVLLTPTQNGIQNYYDSDENINTKLNNLNDNEIVKLKDIEFDNLKDNEILKLKDNVKIIDPCNLEKLEILENLSKIRIKNELIQQSLPEKENIVDYNNNIIEINENKLKIDKNNLKLNKKENKELNKKSKNDNRIELRNFNNYFLTNYGNYN